MPALELLLLPPVAAVALLLAAFLWPHLRAARPAASAWPWRPGSFSERSSVALLVIAHPDDEAMFFAPTVAALSAAGWRVRLLSLSTGSAGGDGAVRTAELAASAAVDRKSGV